MAKLIPLLSRTMLVIVRSAPAKNRVGEEPAAWERRFWKAVGAKLKRVRPLLPTMGKGWLEDGDREIIGK